jgi:hypothetical protein
LVIRFEMIGYKEVEFQDLAKGLSGVDAEEMSRPNAGLLLALVPKGVQTTSKDTGILVGTMHLFWNPKYDV